MVKRAVDYRRIKKALNQYYDFTFTMPKKGKDFTPQQKSAITRKYNKVKTLIDNDTVSFLKYPKNSKLPRIDGVRTDKGVIYKYPDAELKFSKKEKKYLVVVTPKSRKGKTLTEKRQDVLITFPPSILGNPELIERFVEALKEKYSPDDIRWSTEGRRESVRYDASLFSFYFDINQVQNESDYWRHKKYMETSEKKPDYYNGVFLVYYL